MPSLLSQAGRTVGKVVQEYKKNDNFEKTKFFEGSFKQFGLSNEVQMNIAD
jgi:hypothetical protein